MRYNLTNYKQAAKIIIELEPEPHFTLKKVLKDTKKPSKRTEKNANLPKNTTRKGDIFLHC